MKIMSAGVKADVKQEIKELEAVSRSFLQPSKLEIQYQTNMHFFI